VEETSLVKVKCEKEKNKYTRKSLLKTKTTVVEALEMVKERDYYTLKP